jgi:predicted PurR-regulated permease PerM
MVQTLFLVLGMLIGAVIFSLIYAVTGVLKINKQIVIQKDYDDALSNTIDSVKDHLTKMIDDVKRDLRDDVNNLHQQFQNKYSDIFDRFENTDLHFDKTIGNVIEILQTNIDDSRKYTDSRIDKLIVHTKKQIDIADNSAQDNTTQINS